MTTSSTRARGHIGHSRAREFGARGGAWWPAGAGMVGHGGPTWRPVAAGGGGGGGGGSTTGARQELGAAIGARAHTNGGQAQTRA